MCSHSGPCKKHSAAVQSGNDIWGYCASYWCCGLHWKPSYGSPSRKRMTHDRIEHPSDRQGGIYALPKMSGNTPDWHRFDVPEMMLYLLAFASISFSKYSFSLLAKSSKFLESTFVRNTGSVADSATSCSKCVSMFCVILAYSLLYALILRGDASFDITSSGGAAFSRFFPDAMLYRSIRSRERAGCVLLVKSARTFSQAISFGV